MTINTSNIIEIPLTLLREHEVERLTDFFTVELRDKNSGDVTKRYYHYAKNDTSLFLPKYTKIKEIIGRDIEVNVTNKPFNDNTGLFSDVENKIELRNDKQRTTVEFMQNNLDKDMLISLSTGSGKTILTIRHFLVNNLKPIIFCHNLTIMQQWVDKCVMMGIDRDDIGTIQGSYSRNKLKGKKVYVASTPTIESNLKNVEKTNFLYKFLKEEKIDLFVVDEAHKLFNSVSKILFSFDVPQKVLLTATATRSLSEELEILRHVFPVDNCLDIVDYEQPVDVFLHHFNSSPKPGEIYLISMLDKYKFNSNMYTSYMLRKPDNTYFRLVDHTRRLYLKNLSDNVKNKVLICGYTVKQLDYLFDNFNHHYPELKIKRFYGTHKSKEEHIPITGDDTDIILCVTGSIDAGFDVEDMTLLINLCYNKSEALLIQLKGRLSRTYDGKKRAIYVNMIDNGIPFIGGKRSGDIEDVIAKEGKSILFRYDSNIVLPENISKKKK